MIENKSDFQLHGAPTGTGKTLVHDEFTAPQSDPPRLRPGEPIPPDRVLLTLSEAAPRIAQTRARLLHLARIRDIASVQIDREFFFRPEALREWVARNERKAAV